MMALVAGIIQPRGGWSSKFQMFAIKRAGEGLAKPGKWITEGTVEPHAQKVYEFEAFQRHLPDPERGILKGSS